MPPTRKSPRLCRRGQRRRRQGRRPASLATGGPPQSILHARAVLGGWAARGHRKQVTKAYMKSSPRRAAAWRLSLDLDQKHPRIHRSRNEHEQDAGKYPEKASARSAQKIPPTMKAILGSSRVATCSIAQDFSLPSMLLRLTTTSVCAATTTPTAAVSIPRARTDWPGASANLKQPEHSPRSRGCRPSPRELRILGYLFEVYGDRDEQQTRQHRRSTDRSQEEVMPRQRAVGGHDQALHFWHLPTLLVTR